MSSITSNCHSPSAMVSVYRYCNGAWSEPSYRDCDSDRTLVLVFAAPAYMDSPGPIQKLRKAFPNSHMIGCSTAGEISDATLHDDSIIAAVIPFTHTDLRSASAPVARPEDSFEAGQTVARQLRAKDLRGILIFSDGLGVNGSELVRGLNSELPSGVVITGGLAADGPRFKRTWTLQNGALLQGHVVAVGLYGDRVRIGHGSHGGWDVFGPERLVTRSTNNILYELDGQPALALYKKYLGELASGLPAAALRFPLSLRRRESDAEQRLVRTILSIDEAEQSLTFAGDVPQGSLGQFMRANLDRLIDGAGESAHMTNQSILTGQAWLSIAISCVGRRLVLGERTEEELERAMENLSGRQIGFYSYGELSPLCSGVCELHNQTMTITTIHED